MKKRILIISLLSIILFANFVFGISNPTAIYCEEMGYEFDMIEHSDGSQEGICKIRENGLEIDCNSWEYYSGDCAPEYSYCSKQGYGIETVEGEEDPISRRYAVCIIDDSQSSKNKVSGNIISNSNESIKENPIEFLKKIQDFILSTITGYIAQENTKKRVPLSELYDIQERGGSFSDLPVEKDEKDYSITEPDSAPSSFDWRNYNGINWMTSVKDQGSCGSCWSFSAIGTAEANYNIDYNNSDLDPDISEQYLVTDCLSGNNTCCGGYLTSALAYIRDEGIPDEGCFPYNDGGCSCYNTNDNTCNWFLEDNCNHDSDWQCSDYTCSDRCSSWNTRLWSIDGYVGGLSLSDSEIKQRLVDNGPLAVHLGIGSSFGGYFDGDIYRCSDDSGTNHAVILVGYNDSGNYWIIKNSWGSSWNGDGYYKLGYGECNVNIYVIYLNKVKTNHPSVSLISPNDGHVSNKNEMDFNFTVNNAVDSTSTCQLIINGDVKQQDTSVDNGVMKTFTESLAEGEHSWNITCWENNVGAINTSETRDLTTDELPPAISIQSPQQIIYGDSSINLEYSVSDSSGVDSCWFTNTTGKNESLSGCQDKVMTGIEEGEHTIILYSNDSAGNKNSESVTFNVDLTSPDINFSKPTPQDDVITDNTSIMINVSVEENISNVSSCILEWDNSNTSMNKLGEGKKVSCYKVVSITGSGIFGYKVYSNDSFDHMAVSESRQIEITNTPPNITSYLPVEEFSIPEPNNQTFNITYEDINNDLITISWYRNNKLVDSGENYTFYGNYSTSGNYNISVRISDGKDNDFQSWNMTIDNTNRLPEIKNLTINSTDPLNRTNGTLAASWDFYDLDGDIQQDYKISWYRNGSEVTNLENLTSIKAGNTTKNEEWKFNISIMDNYDWSTEMESPSIIIHNLPPEFFTIEDITVNESELVNITANVSDEDTITYTINSTKFLQADNSFLWYTDTSDSGNYTFLVNITDGTEWASQAVSVSVIDAFDFDGDGSPDYEDEDDDNDGLLNEDDTLKGNSSNINSNIEVKIQVNGSEDLAKTINEEQIINITNQTNSSLVNFNWNFSEERLVVNWSVEYNKTEGIIKVRGLNLSSQGYTKVMYIDKPSTNHNYVCIADDETTSFLPENCSGYTRIKCDGSGQCSDLGNNFKISGLDHSIARAIYVDEGDDEEDNGGGGSDGGDSDSSSSITGFTGNVSANETSIPESVMNNTEKENTTEDKEKEKTIGSEISVAFKNYKEWTVTIVIIFFISVLSIIGMIIWKFLLDQQEKEILDGEE